MFTADNHDNQKSPIIILIILIIQQNIASFQRTTNVLWAAEAEEGVLNVLI